MAEFCISFLVAPNLLCNGDHLTESLNLFFHLPSRTNTHHAHGEIVEDQRGRMCEEAP